MRWLSAGQAACHEHAAAVDCRVPGPAAQSRLQDERCRSGVNRLRHVHGAPACRIYRAVVGAEVAQIPTHAQPSHWASRLCHVRQFARYRSASDPRTQIPALGLLPFQPKRARPYLYTDEEIEQLLHTTLHMPLSPQPRNTCALLPWVYYCLFGLLSVSGLRLGEARNLKLEDVDLRAGVLTVRGGKFGKDRWVPIHPTTCKVLSRYIERRKRHWGARPVSPYLLVSSWGNRLDGAQVHRAFYAASRRIGLRGARDSHGPRLHDLRHRFATTTLVNLSLIHI